MASKEVNLMSVASSPSAVKPPTEAASSFAIGTVRLTKKYGATEAVRGIDLSVERGEIFGLIGPDGAGKTTTFQILAGAMEASSCGAEGFCPSAPEMPLLDRYLSQ